jgi:hypothetical protein
MYRIYQLLSTGGKQINPLARQILARTWIAAAEFMQRCKTISFKAFIFGMYEYYRIIANFFSDTVHAKSLKLNISRSQ